MMNKVSRTLPLLLAVSLPAAAFSFWGAVDFEVGDEPFTEAALQRGVKATTEQCAAVPNAVWVKLDGAGECLRYWAAGFPADGSRVGTAVVFFGGDLLNGNAVLSSSYLKQRPSQVQDGVDRAARLHGVPYVFLARPGTFGSSGAHKQRRRTGESRLVSGALDAVKSRFSVGDWALAGQSGGGHVVAALLTLRSDTVCAVLTSAVSSPRLRYERKGLLTDTTGYADSYEPVGLIQKSVLHADLRVFVLGDPQDSNTPFDTQLPLAEAVRAAGRTALSFEGEGTGRERHVLAASGILIAAMCARGATTEQIRTRASVGFKG